MKPHDYFSLSFINHFISQFKIFQGVLVLWNSTKPASVICDLKLAIRCLALHNPYSQQTMSTGNGKKNLSMKHVLVLVGLDDGNIATFSLLQVYSEDILCN